MKILVADDDLDLLDLVAYALGQTGYLVAKAADGNAALTAFEAEGPDLVILDINMPGQSGFEVCAAIRGRSTVPVMMLTARGEEHDLVRALDLGADDYLTKPFSPRTLLARVKALLRRAAPDNGADEVLSFGRLEVDLGARQARLDGKPCDLTSHQFDLLVVLAQSPGRVLSRDQIMDSLKGHPLEAFDRSIDVHISRIRAVIEEDPKTPRRVLTVRGAGYVFAKKQDGDDES